MRGVAAQRIVRTIRKPRNKADEAIAPKPGWDGAFRAICFVARLANSACYWHRLASRSSSRKASVATTRGLFRGSLKLVCPLCERVRELPCELEGLVLIDLVLGDQLREKSAVHAPSNVVPSGYRKKRAGVVVEADGVVEACRFGHLLPKALHARGAVIEPPWRSELQNRIVTGEGSQLAGVCCLVQREEDQG